MDRFSPGVDVAIQHYVYRLVDPRNGETFYIGKGQANRLFDHVRAADDFPYTEDSDELNPKLDRIRSIRNEGLEVVHIIHRHGMEYEVARQVEAALIDAFPGLTNIQTGHRSNDFGPMHAQQIDAKYTARPLAVQDGDQLLIININNSLAERDNDVYEAVRYAWPINVENARRCNYVLAAYRGIIKGVFVAEEWQRWTRDFFDDVIDENGRKFGFRGHEAPPEVKGRYMNCRYAFPGRYPINYMPRL